MRPGPADPVGARGVAAARCRPLGPGRSSVRADGHWPAAGRADDDLEDMGVSDDLPHRMTGAREHATDVASGPEDRPALIGGRDGHQAAWGFLILWVLAAAVMTWLIFFGGSPTDDDPRSFVIAFALPGLLIIYGVAGIGVLAVRGHAWAYGLVVVIGVLGAFETVPMIPLVFDERVPAALSNPEMVAASLVLLAPAWAMGWAWLRSSGVLSRRRGTPPSSGPRGGRPAGERP